MGSAFIYNTRPYHEHALSYNQTYKFQSSIFKILHYLHPILFILLSADLMLHIDATRTDNNLTDIVVG